MTDGPALDLDDRLARLAAKRAGASTVEVVPTARKRAHPASTSRLVAGWISTSAFLSIVVALSVQQQSSAAPTAASAAPRGGITPVTGAGTTVPKVVVKEVHHKVFVDPSGHPIAPASIPRDAVVVPQTAGTETTPSGASSVSSPRTRTGVTTPATRKGQVPPRTTPVTSPPPTSPPPTSPPRTTPTTVFKPPPPPPPPPCTATKCP